MHESLMASVGHSGTILIKIVPIGPYLFWVFFFCHFDCIMLLFCSLWFKPHNSCKEIFEKSSLNHVKSTLISYYGSLVLRHFPRRLYSISTRLKGLVLLHPRRRARRQEGSVLHPPQKCSLTCRNTFLGCIDCEFAGVVAEVSSGGMAAGVGGHWKGVDDEIERIEIEIENKWNCKYWKWKWEENLKSRCTFFHKLELRKQGYFFFHKCKELQNSEFFFLVKRKFFVFH